MGNGGDQGALGEVLGNFQLLSARRKHVDMMIGRTEQGSDGEDDQNMRILFWAVSPHHSIRFDDRGSSRFVVEQRKDDHPTRGSRDNR